MEHLKSAGGIHIEYEQQNLPYQDAIKPLLERLDSHRGALFASSFEIPGRYTRWDIGFYNPPLVLTYRNNTFRQPDLDDFKLPPLYNWTLDRTA